MLKPNYYTEPTELDTLVFEKLVPQDHYLRQVKQVIDFEALRDKVRDCYSAEMGRSAEDPVILIKLEFLQFQYNLSDREVIAEAQVNVAYRYFLDLSLDSELPVPSLLSQFRTRLGEERHQALFDEIVAQARAHGLVKDRLRLKDATHVIANIAIPSTIQLVAQVRQKLLESARPYAAQQVAEAEGEVVRIRQATVDLKDSERLLQRVAHLRRIVAWADEVQRRLGPAPADPEPTRQRFDEALSLAHQVLADQDRPPSKKKKKKGEKRDRLLSVVDPEARQGKHGHYYNGYQLDISLDAASELLTAVNVLPANGDEAADAETLVRTEEAAHHNDIQELSMDGIGFRGHLLRTLSDPTGLRLTVYVPPSPQTNSGPYFTPDDFQLEERGTCLRCPAEEETRQRYRNKDDNSWMFLFRRSQCAMCRLMGRCMERLPQQQGRSVTKNDYEAEYKAARQRAETERYRQVRQDHPKVERKLAEIVRYHGGRYARYRRLARVTIQYLLTGIVVNIKRIVNLLRTRGQFQPVSQPV